MKRLRKTIATSANRDTERLLGEPGLHTAKKHQAAESREHHGQTTTLWNDRKGISLAGVGTPHCAVSARQIHAGHSPWDEAWRCDDVSYFLGDHHPRAHCFASSLAHHPSRRTGQFASSLATADIRGRALAALCARSCDYDDGLDLCVVRGWSIRLFFAIPLPTLPTEGSLLANSIGKWHGTMEWALLLVIGAHVAAAMAHTFIFRDRIMQRMLPEEPMVARTGNLKPEVVAMKPAQESRAG
jgi:hypothetical protein